MEDVTLVQSCVSLETVDQKLRIVTLFKFPNSVLFIHFDHYIYIYIYIYICMYIFTTAIKAFNRFYKH